MVRRGRLAVGALSSHGVPVIGLDVEVIEEQRDPGDVGSTPPAAGHLQLVVGQRRQGQTARMNADVDIEATAPLPARIDEVIFVVEEAGKGGPAWTNDEQLCHSPSPVSKQAPVSTDLLLVEDRRHDAPRGCGGRS